MREKKNLKQNLQTQTKEQSAFHASYTQCSRLRAAPKRRERRIIKSDFETRRKLHDNNFNSRREKRATKEREREK